MTRFPRFVCCAIDEDREKQFLVGKQRMGRDELARLGKEIRDDGGNGEGGERSWKVDKANPTLLDVYSSSP